MPTWPSMHNVQEQEGPKSFKIVGQQVVLGENDMENQKPVAGTVVLKEEDVNDDVDPGIDNVEDRMSVMTFLKIVTFFSALYMATNPWFFFWDPDKQEICPYTVLCAQSPAELILLTGSRISAGILFASITISILTKCYATRAYVHHSWLGAVLDFEPTHDVHIYFGYLTLVAGWEHAILHCARFIVAGNAFLIYEKDTSRSGLVACVVLLPIVLPMKYDFFKKKMKFQTRKNMHMMFLAFLIALCFHSIVFRYVGSILIIWYIFDRLYYTTKQTFLITHPTFEAVGRGTMVSWELPEGYTFKAGSYIYVNSPTISRSEWHPFSIIQVPGQPPRAAFYAEAVGDWTQELFHLGLSQPRLPLWITAAQPSLMEKSIYFDNLVLIATGAGITPAVSIIERFAKRKNIHLMWMSRDGGMVALFEKPLRKVNSTVHLTGKPTDNTKEALRRLLQPSKFPYGGIASPAPAMRQTQRTKSFVLRLPRMGSTTENRPTPTQPMASMNEEGVSEESKAAAMHVVEGLNTMPAPAPQLVKNDHSIDVSQSRRPKMLVNKSANPVKLEFGRPDIGKFLTETFSSPIEVFASVDETGRGSLGPMADRSVAGSRAGRPHRARQGSARLDESQIVSKEALMKADPGVVGTVQQKRAPSGSVAANSGASAGKDGPPKLPWLVLYCGANPKVEEAIETTCNELHVQWQKEYFGAW